MVERFNFNYDNAYETPLHTHLPIVEDVCLSKPRGSIKIKGNPRPESTTDETWDVSSNQLESYSSYTSTSKKGKKRRSEKFSEVSASDLANFSICEGKSENPVGTKHTPFITLSCPLCSDPECVLNVAASCPLLRHNETEVEKCGFCHENCDCENCKSKLLPVSGLVARDENGVAETLLKANGGPIENSYEWANRKRWVVPNGVNWNHQVGQWITSRMLESSNTHLEGTHRKRSKSRSKRKNRHPSAPTSTQAHVPTHTDNSNQVHKVEDQKIILEGIGFKIINRGHETILINFDKKNCKILGCSCQNEDKPSASCGCDGGSEEGQAKKCDKGNKSSCKVGKSSKRISVMKETSHGLMEVNMNNLDKFEKDNLVTSDKNVSGQIEDNKEHTIEEHKTEGKETRKSHETTQETIPNKSKNKKEDNKGKQSQRENSSSGVLTGQDVRHSSRTLVLEEHLRSTLGASYKNSPKTEEQVACRPSNMYQPEVMMPPMEMLSPCMCAGRYCYTSACGSVARRRITKVKERKMTTIRSCPCNQNELSKTAPPCPFVKIVDKFPECPCFCIPSINAGPPCPFKSPPPGLSSPLQCILRPDQTQNGSALCPLSRLINDDTSFHNPSQLCTFSEPEPINFKDWPVYQCSCVPGTCPEIAKNLIRSWGIDPMCLCPCPSAAAMTNGTVPSDGTMTGDKSKIIQRKVEGKIKNATELSNVNASSMKSSGSNVKISASKLITPTRDSVTVLAGGPYAAQVVLSSSAKLVDSADVDDGSTPSEGKLITSGKGFKIYEINGEQILINYSKKNCKWLKCECSKREKSCGCDEWIRMTKYRHCSCPGAKKSRPVSVKAVVKDQRTQRPEHSTETADERKSVKYSNKSVSRIGSPTKTFS